MKLTTGARKSFASHSRIQIDQTTTFVNTFATNTVTHTPKTIHSTSNEKYRRNTRALSALQQESPLQSKNFIFLDGESIDGKYVLLGTSHSSYCLEDKQGIATDDALDFLWRLGANRHIRKKKTTFCGYFFSYDVEMICRDLPKNIKRRLFNPRLILTNDGKLIKDRVFYKEYELTYIKRKFFSVRRKGESTNGITVYDVSGFFTGFPSRSFVAVLQQLRIDVPPEIEAGKSERQRFDWQHYQQIKEYNALECAKGVELMQKIYAMTEPEGLTPRRWYGSSAIGNLALRKWKISDYMRRTVEENLSPYFWEAITCAYFGGRIEAFKLGSFENVYSYDIASAYPHAIVDLPATRDNRFVYSADYRKGFGVWHVRFKFPKSIGIGIFPFRMADGSIKFPLSGEGWYWSPEVQVALEHWPECVEIIEGYRITNEKKKTPFRRLFPKLYKRRQAYKRKGDLKHFVLKIVLNSIYGKFAQKVGRADFKNFSWAGYITSHTRARLREAVIGKEKHIIAFSTDGIYSLVPLRLELSDELGGWEQERFKSGTVLMSGVYLMEGKDKVKRGERGYKSLSDWYGILEQLNKRGRKGAEVFVRLFIGFNMADKFSEEYGADYLQFVERTKEINPYNLSKRRYLTSQIKDWHTDFCDSEPIGKLSGMSAAIKTTPDFVEADDVIFTENEDELLWTVKEF